MEQTIGEALDHDRSGPAIVSGDFIIGYDEYRQQAHCVQAALNRHGMGSGDTVGLHFEKSPEYLVALAGAWFAGCVVVPLNRTLPDERLNFIADDAGLDATLSRVDDAPGDRIINYEQARQHAPASTVEERDPDNPAYIFYTSGTTGRPKGVVVPHRNVVPALREQIDHFDIDADDNVTLYLSIDFDASLSDIGTALLSGATLHLVPDAIRKDPDRLCAFLDEHAITVADLPPALLGAIDPEACPSSLETIIAGGEAYDPAVMRDWARQVRLFNVYGPTEATICSSLNRIDPETWDRPYLGEPIAGAEYRLESIDGAQELLVGGPGVAIGYHNRPIKTDEQFVKRDGKRYFRTGDAVERHEGRLVFQGRTDRQFQLHGHRIQPEEIEQQLMDEPGVRRAACVRHPDHGLVAFIEAGSVDEQALSDHLTDTLPEYMVPARFVECDLPETSSGKVDYEVLRSRSLSGPDERTKPKNETEATIVEAFGDVLDVPVGRRTNFFENGGDSLGVVRLVLRLDEAGLTVAPEQIEQHPTPAGLADTEAGEANPFSTSERSVGDLVADARLDNEMIDRLNTYETTNKPDTYLLTGATGQLGRYVLYELLSQTEAQIDLVVRAESREQAHERISRSLSELPDGPPDGWEGGVRALVGDVSAPELGLSDYDRVTGRVDSVVHVAGQVNLVGSYETLRPVNTEGVRRMVRLAAEAQARMLHVSTLSVFVGTDHRRGVISEPDDMTDASCVYGGYAQSKFAADRLMQNALQSGLDGAIVRPGLIVGDRRTGHVRDQGLLGLFLRGIRRLGVVPRSRQPELAFDFTPVNDVARVIGALADQQREGVFHYANETSVTLDRLIRVLSEVGTDLEVVEPSDWANRAVGTDIPTAFARYAMGQCLPGRAYRTYRGLDLFEATGVEFDMSKIRRTLGAKALPPEPSDELLKRYLRSN